MPGSHGDAETGRRGRASEARRVPGHGWALPGLPARPGGEENGEAEATRAAHASSPTGRAACRATERAGHGSVVNIAQSPLPSSLLSLGVQGAVSFLTRVETW